MAVTMSARGYASLSRWEVCASTSGMLQLRLLRNPAAFMPRSGATGASFSFSQMGQIPCLTLKHFIFMH
jgi:hypothetical protein